MPLERSLVAFLVVVSQRGVYSTHHWEKPTFSPSSDFSGIGSQEFFKENVLDVIDQGGLDAPSLPRYTYNNGPLSAKYNPKVFIFKRSSSGHTAYDTAYNNKVEQLSQHVASIVGVPALVQPYFNRNSEAGDYSTDGKVFFEYDPRAENCDPPKAGYRLWVEDSLAGHDEWTPAENQNPEASDST